MAGQLRDLIRSTYRDFAIDGVPASGENHPDKAEIRYALGTVLENALSTIGAGIVKYATKAAMDADTTRGDGVIAFVQRDGPNNGAYQYYGGVWETADWYFDAVAGVVEPLVIAATEARDQAEALLAPYGEIEPGLREGVGEVLYDAPTVSTTAFPASNGLLGFCLVVDGIDLVGASGKALVGGVKEYLQLSAGTVRVRTQLYRRLIAEGNEAPGAADSDTLLHTAEYSPTSLGLMPGGAMEEVTSLLPLTKSDTDYSYVLVIEAFDASGNLKPLGIGQANEDPSKPGRYAGFFRRPDGVWVTLTGSRFGSTWFYPSYVDVNGLSARVDENDLFNRRVEKSFDREFRAVASRPSDGNRFPAGDEHTDWGVALVAGQDVQPGDIISSFKIAFDYSATVTRIQLNVWKRPTGSADGSLGGAGARDTALYSNAYTLVSLGLAAPVFAPAEFMIPTIMVDEGFTYLFEFRGTNDSGIKQFIGVAITQSVPSGLTPDQRGSYDRLAFLGPPLAIAWEVGDFIYAIDGNASEGGADTRDRLDDVSLSASGLTISVQGTFNRAGKPSTFSSALTLPGTTTFTATNEARVLTSPNPLAALPTKGINAAGKLTYSNVSSVVVRAADTNAILIEGSDYLLEPIEGTLSRTSAGPNRDVLVSYQGAKRRYDLIAINAETRAVVSVQGTPRDSDPGEYMPKATSASLIPIAYASVASGLPIETVPVWYLDNGVHRDLNASRAADYAKQRRALAPLIAKAIRGETIKIAAMGDSILAQEGPVPDPAYYEPNGAHRDRTAYFAGNIGPDRIAQLQRYDLGDGYGQAHVRTSVGWSVVRALEDLGATVEYYCFAVGGTSSGGGADTFGGKDPALRAAVWAVQPDALIAHYGMNETGSTQTEANLVDLGQAAFANGVLAYLTIGQPRPGARKNFTMEGLRSTWRQTRRAAEYFRNGAYFATERLSDDPYRGALGLTPIDICTADAFHHPGIHECEVIGEELRAMITGL